MELTPAQVLDRLDEAALTLELEYDLHVWFNVDECLPAYALLYQECFKCALDLIAEHGLTLTPYLRMKLDELEAMDN